MLQPGTSSVNKPDALTNVKRSKRQLYFSYTTVMITCFISLELILKRVCIFLLTHSIAFRKTSYLSAKICSFVLRQRKNQAHGGETGRLYLCTGRQKRAKTGELVGLLLGVIFCCMYFQFNCNMISLVPFKDLHFLKSLGFC